ncbi:MAG TPA: flagellar biosynthesis protein FlhB [Blastocatellia bacterium]|nr:flagellar biosynthesis protein FlhB [Blastocatellia bacterium]
MASNRTEKPTPKRREDARKRGQIARRPELPAAVGFLAALLMLRMLSEQILKHATDFMAGTMLQVSSDLSLTPVAATDMLMTALARLVVLSAPIIAAVLVAGVASSFAQGGFLFTPGALKPKGERFNPIANLKRALGLEGVMQFAKSLLVIAAMVAVCYGTMKQAMGEAPALLGAPAPQVIMILGDWLYRLGLRAGLVVLVFAVLDYAWGWYRHEQSLKMTKQEIKDEYRQQEGDPMVKGQRRRMARAMLQRHIATEVPKADVVVTNPTHFAVALRYDREEHAAPIVVAKGADDMAQRIREIARAHNVPVVENPPLARALYRTVEIGRMIPADLFRTVAELLAYVFRQRAGIAQD